MEEKKIFASFLEHGLEIKEVEGKGRGVFTTRAFPAGALLLPFAFNAPLAVCVSDDARLTHCHLCLSELGGRSAPLGCASCAFPLYCSERCRRLDEAHSRECAAFARVAPRAPPLDMRLLWRVLPRAQEAATLRSHRSEFLRETRWREAFGSIAALTVRHYLAARAGERSSALEQCLDLLCLMKCNNFVVGDDEYAPLGVGLWPRAALFNHSCDPNAAVLFERGAAAPRCAARALRPLVQGEEVFFSYVEAGEAVARRREELLDSFFFECRCRRCRGGLPVPQAPLPPAAATLRVAAAQALAEARHEAAAAALRDAARALEMQGGGSARRQPPWLFLMNDLMRAEIAAGRFNAAFAASESMQDAVVACYPKGNFPIKGMFWALHARLANYVGAVETALRYAQMAREVFVISHGPNHQILEKLVFC